jgi:hypothetical protein
LGDGKGRVWVRVGIRLGGFRVRVDVKNRVRVIRVRVRVRVRVVG